MTHIVKGSLGAMAQAANSSLAEAFMSADTVILVDTSGSMASFDNDRLSRYDRACEELERLQGNLEGRIAVISFSGNVSFCPSGVPINYGGGTDIAGALKFAHVADGCVDRFILISDGEPQDESAALREAKKFTTKIDTIFIGSEGGDGQDFLHRLAAASGGSSATIKQAAQLGEKIERLMLTAV
jgi:Mg-chelatase subunit ChlD